MGLFGGSKKPWELIHQAMLLMDAKQPKAAIALFKKALKNEPDNVTALYNQGLALNQLKNSAVLPQNNLYIYQLYFELIFLGY